MAAPGADAYFMPDRLNEALYNHLVPPQKFPHREDGRSEALGVALLDWLVSSPKTIAAEAPLDDNDAASQSVIRAR
jgi:hypothetical protein